MINIWMIIAVIGFCHSAGNLTGQSISDTFDTGEISTNLGSFSPSCNGPITKISITLPQGGPWNVSGIDASYNMTAQSGGFKSHQRSYIRCQNTATSEDSVYQGTGNIGGIQVYNRMGIPIANGYYPGGTILHFEMRAWRTEIGSGCNTTFNKVDNFTWILTVNFAQIPNEGSVGIGTTTPAVSAILELNSTTQAFLLPRMTTAQRDAIASPLDGMVIFNITTQKLEVFASGWGTMFVSSPGVKRLYGGGGNDISFSIQQTNDGGFIVAGFTDSSNSGTLSGLNNNGTYDSWILKMDNAGNIDWQKLFGGLNEDLIQDITQSSDGGYIVAGTSLSSNTGTLTGEINNGFLDDWIIKLDENGNIVWQNLLGGTEEDRATSIQPTNDGGFIVAGYSLSSNTGTLTGMTNNGLTDAWIIKLDSVGNIVWQKLLGGNADDFAYSIHQTTDGGYIVGGSSFSSNTGTLTGLINYGQSDNWIFKLDGNGNTVWQKLYGGTNPEIASSIEQTADGGFIIASDAQSSNSGTLAGFINHGSWDYWILKISDSGVVEWQKLYGGNLSEQSHSIQQTVEGGYIVTGYSTSSNNGTLQGVNSNGGYDFWILKLDNAGIITWQKLLGGSGDEIAYSVDQTSDGGYIITGDSDSSNDGTLVGMTSNGMSDYWIIKLDATGNLH